jgi:hypothetical protein
MIGVPRASSREVGAGVSYHRTKYLPADLNILYGDLGFRSQVNMKNCLGNEAAELQILGVVGDVSGASTKAGE